MNVVEEAPEWKLAVREICSRKRRLDIVIGTVARIVRAILGGKVELVKQHPSDWERWRAEKLLLHVFQDEVRVAEENKRLRGLMPFHKNGICYTTGRFDSDHLLELTGKTSLPVIMGNSRLGILYTIRGHEKDHRREAANILSRVRRSVCWWEAGQWLPGWPAHAPGVAYRGGVQLSN